MKVLQVINSLSGGGAETFMTDLSIALSKQKNIEISVLVYAGILDKKGEELAQKLFDHGIEIISLNILNNPKKIIIPYLFNKRISDPFIC